MADPRTGYHGTTPGNHAAPGMATAVAAPARPRFEEPDPARETMVAPANKKNKETRR